MISYVVIPASNVGILYDNPEITLNQYIAKVIIDTTYVTYFSCIEILERLEVFFDIPGFEVYNFIL